MRRLLLPGLVTLVACNGGPPAPPAHRVPEAAAPAGPAHDEEVMTAIRRGRALFFGKAICSTCHRVDDEGTMVKGPNIGAADDMKLPVASRAAERIPGVSATTYVVDSILDPDAFVVQGYAPGVMKTPADIPLDLSDDDVVAIVAFVLSVGATEPIRAPVLTAARERIPVARAARERRRDPGSR